MSVYSIDDILEVFLDKVSSEGNPEIRTKTKKMFYEDIKDEIISIEREKIISGALKEKESIINDGKKEKQILIEEGKREVEKSKAMYAIEKAKNLFRDGIIVAFIVGILVNQFTDLITPFKVVVSTASSYNVVIITFVIVALLVWIVYMLVKKTYFNKIEEYIKQDISKENIDGSTI